MCNTMFQERKAAFKTPPMKDSGASQDVRRAKALEEQKRRRAERIDSSRQLDFFADLTLGPSDEEGDDTEDVVREGISQFASLLPPPASADASSTLPAAPALPPPSETAEPITPDVTMQAQAPKKKKRKGKGRATSQPAKAGGKKNTKASKWADKCMYAELLEMRDGFDVSGDLRDGIPDDIESGWVAVAPVPVGKRCLAVTHQTSGMAGVVPNTTLRSRVLGKPLIKPFPSILPPQTVLDCILDENWRENGILHILDVVTWKGQDLADCDTPFRLWWRDTRLSELSPLPPPPNAAPPTQQHTLYQFPHPTTFAPVPYHTDTTLPYLLSTLIPLTRTARRLPITVPVLSGADATMDLDMDGSDGASEPAPLVQLQTAHVDVQSDGLLLYVAQATYEPGTSPLSSWVPLRAYQTHEERIERETKGGGGSVAESPLDVFQRLIRRRAASGVGGAPEVEMAP
ncbi:uncharacterized protein TRAVEDRAFT_171933 [Trametes versicolor FP-101664 SS1]|uniref:uncharacterized protein n=1 Tax=Trametes versicolor (strain FP-101664) TaxID=717944 RepID=UPI0004623A48|nr:uncharacterized protein TRAVEDRAFT_171933 [Trametes versicolor FP-101664 SS1]EIW56034.1 hypothetical protein TRAVEDRAFT_171933 [Trametes versicolor FP-101664 SS1]